MVGGALVLMGRTNRALVLNEGLVFSGKSRGNWCSERVYKGTGAQWRNCWVGGSSDEGLILGSCCAVVWAAGELPLLLKIL